VFLYGARENFIHELGPVSYEIFQSTNLNNVIHLNILLIFNPILAARTLPIIFVEGHPIFRISNKNFLARKIKDFFSARPYYGGLPKSVKNELVVIFR